MFEERDDVFPGEAGHLLELRHGDLAAQ
jgi:hypothetical protein